MADRENQGIRLEVVRKSLNLSQVKFSKRIGISQGYYNQVAKGKRNISYKILNAITKHFPQVNPEWILTGIGDMQKMFIEEVNEASTKYGQPRPIALQDLAQIILSIQEENKELRRRIEALEARLDKPKGLP